MFSSTVKTHGDLCFKTICDATLRAAMERVQYNQTYRLTGDVVVHLPVWTNWGGGWSDAPA